MSEFRRRTGLPAWALYDWASNSFATVIQTFVFAAYFTREVAADQTQGSALWGNVIGASGLFVAFLGPVLGAIADQGGQRKPWILGFTCLAVVSMAALWYVRPSPDYVWFALFFVALGTLGSEFATIFYNAMLPGLAPAERVGRWSGWGWAMGYGGGLFCLLAVLLGFVREDAWFVFNRVDSLDVRAAFPFAAAWYLFFALPLFFMTPDAPASGKRLRQQLRDGLGQLKHSFLNVRRYSPIVRFLIARIFYTDGLATLFVFGGVYAAGTFDMSAQKVLTFGIVLNITAALGAVCFAWIDDWIGGKKTVMWSLAGLIVTTATLLLIDSEFWFWILGLVLGIFVGPVQAASRSFLSRVAPPALRTEFFGLYALSGKATAFMGPLLVGWLTYLSGSQRIGMSIIVVYFLIGLVLMRIVPDDRKCK